MYEFPADLGNFVGNECEHQADVHWQTKRDSVVEIEAPLNAFM